MTLLKRISFVLVFVLVTACGDNLDALFEVPQRENGTAGDLKGLWAGEVVDTEYGVSELRIRIKENETIVALRCTALDGESVTVGGTLRTRINGERFECEDRILVHGELKNAKCTLDLYQQTYLIRLSGRTLELASSIKSLNLKKLAD